MLLLWNLMCEYFLKEFYEGDWSMIFFLVVSVWYHNCVVIIKQVGKCALSILGGNCVRLILCLPQIWENSPLKPSRLSLIFMWKFLVYDSIFLMDIRHLYFLFHLVSDLVSRVFLMNLLTLSTMPDSFTKNFP